MPFEVIPLCPFVDAQTSQQIAAQNNLLRIIGILRGVAGKRAAFPPNCTNVVNRLRLLCSLSVKRAINGTFFGVRFSCHDAKSGLGDCIPIG